ncbi:M20 family metallopeptidase [Halomarina pelagica]|uniref:M20 family metallopeptidase n=1 Tax=Halomarina pelagica TaxID=2961599 RepID=UPI0020C35F87|nr:M20/M25/M40 family metallo-hydrolase [Halomarina sp. BND7]
MNSFASRYDDDLRAFVERLVSFDSITGDEAPIQGFVREHLDELGFETYEWTADADRLAAHPSFPDDPGAIDVTDRPSVGGVLELGDPDAGPTLVFNGHVDVVPAEGEWSSDPFAPSWDGDRLTARGAADMKSGLAACVYAARALADEVEEGGENGEDAGDVNGRLVVDAVAGEEEGGIGAAAAALDNPYPFERDAAIVAEPTRLRPVVATEGSLMVRLHVEGRSAHAASSWRGESVLPHFESVRRALVDFEAERAERVTHPLYEDFPVPWPVVVGTVRAGRWASTVPAELDAEVRVGVAPGETVDDVEAELRDRLETLAEDDPWLADHLRLERFSVQFEASEIDPDEPIVGAVVAAMEREGLSDAEPTGVTYGADARHYVEAGIPAVLFGPGTVEQAHFPDETIDWSEVLTAGAVLKRAAETYLSRSA